MWGKEAARSRIPPVAALMPQHKHSRAGMINSERPYPPHAGSDRPALLAGSRRWLAFCHS